MRRPTAAQMEGARQLFALEAHKAATSEDYAAAAGRVHDKLFARLASLVSVEGARAIFTRSLKLAAIDFPCLGTVDRDARSTESKALVDCLRGQAPAAVIETAVALYATLLSLLETLIGARLTVSVLRTAWPAFGATKEETRQ